MSADPRASDRRAILLLVALVILLYLPALQCGFIWDDDAYVLGNPTLRSLSGLQRIWFSPGATPQYYPLVFTTFWLEFNTWGLWPAGYHAVNIALHALAAVLAYRCLRALQLPGALFAAALFAAHPVQVESVDWITERKNVLSAVCFFAAALAYLQFALASDLRAPRPPRRYLAALLLFLAALLAKSVTAALPILLAIVLVWRRAAHPDAPAPARHTLAREAPFLVPMLLLGAAAGIHTAWLEHHLVGTRDLDLGLVGLNRLLVAGRAVVFYLSALAWPAKLCFVYPRWQLNPADPRQWLYPAAVLAALLLAAALRRRITAGPLVALLCFLVALFPALGFIDVYPMRYSFVADHFQYLAALAPFALVAAAADRLARRWPRAALHTLVPVATLAALASVTWRQHAAYENLEALWTHTLRRNPAAWIAHNNLAGLLAFQKNHAAALEHYDAARALYPDSPDILRNRAITLANLGRVRDALADFESATRLQPNNPELRHAVGVALLELNRLDDARRELRAALTLRPEFPAAHVALGRLELRVGRAAAAREHLDAARTATPDDPDVALLSARAALLDGQTAAALDALEHLLADHPDALEARRLIIDSLASAGRTDAAIRHARELTTLDRDNPAAFVTLGTLLESAGQRLAAAEALQQALRLDPERAELRARIATLKSGS